MDERYCALLSALTLFTWTSSSPPSLSLWVLIQLVILASPAPPWQGAFPLASLWSGNTREPSSEPAADAKPVISCCLETLIIRQGVGVVCVFSWKPVVLCRMSGDGDGFLGECHRAVQFTVVQSVRGRGVKIPDDVLG